VIRSSSRQLLPRHAGKLLASGILSGSLLLSGCHSSDDKASGPTGIQVLPNQSFAKEWDNQLHLQPGDSVKSLYVRDNAIHILTTQNYDHALKRANGELLYFNPLGNTHSEFHGGPVVLTDYIVFPTTFTLEVFNRKGRFVRSIDLGFTVTSSATGFNNYVFCGADKTGGRLAEIDVSKTYNMVAWSVLTMGPMISAPAVFDSNIFFGSFDGNVRACDDSKVGIWPLLDNNMFKTGNRIVADLRADKDGLYVASTDSRLYCINRQSGKLIWQYFAGTALEQAPEVTKDHVYQFVPGTGLVALNKSHKLDISDKKQVDDPVRDPIWVAANATQFLAEDASYAYVLSSDNHILALDIKTGAQVFQSASSNFVAFGVNNKSDGIVYAATAEGLVVAVKPILREGTAGEMVMDFGRTDPALVASAQ
jgi:outer membrane protein assembly factor BamB